MLREQPRNATALPVLAYVSVGVAVPRSVLVEIETNEAPAPDGKTRELQLPPILCHHWSCLSTSVRLTKSIEAGAKDVPKARL